MWCNKDKPLTCYNSLQQMRVSLDTDKLLFAAGVKLSPRQRQASVQELNISS